MFEKSLTDLVRGIRSNKKNEAVFIGQCIQEIKDEIKQNDPNKKANAVLKLVYLQMLGYDMSWAAFNIIEVMSQTRFTQKRIGYLAASQSFSQETEVIMLATHLIRKDMTSSNIYEAGIAIDCLSNICTPDLARDLAADVVSMLNSSRPYIRKKASLVLYKIFLRFPDALRPSFTRLKEKLEDPDPAVQSAAVNVICELARKNPKNYIGLSPTLFKILTTSTNNWMLIKIIKLFGNLLPIEQRLAKKLIGPLTNLINTTAAMSLLYECIQTCTIGLSDHVPTIKLCITKLRSFVEDPDQNLKYLGLIALNNIMKIHPKAVAEHRDLVINCLDDDDTSIRMRALDLLEGMVSKKNLLDIVRKLVEHIDKTENGTYKDALVEKIVTICSNNSYQAITDFEWYISVLTELSRTQGTKHGTLIASQLMDVIIRVPAIRPFAVKSMVSLLHDSKLLSENPSEGGNCEVLYAAAWVVGEFCSYVTEPLGILDALLQQGAASLPAHIQGIYVQASLKVFALCVSSGTPQKKSLNLLGEEEETPAPPTISRDNAKTDEVIKLLQSRLPLFAQSQYLEVQERACFVQGVLALYQEMQTTGQEIGGEIASLFDEPLNPVGPKAGKKAAKQLPEGLDLDSWINEQPKVETGNFDNNADFTWLKEENETTTGSWDKEIDEDEKQKRKEAQRMRHLNNPHYLPSGSGSKAYRDDDVEGIPIETLTKEQLQGATRDTSSPFYLGSIKAPKKQSQPVTVLKDEVLEGEEDSQVSSDDSDKGEDAGLRADIDWNEPATELPKQEHRVVKNLPKDSKKTRTKSKKERKPKEGGEKKKVHKKKPEAPAADDKLIDLGFDPISSPSVPQEEEAPTSPFETIASPPETREKRKTKKSSSTTKKTTKKKSTKEETKKKSTKGSKKEAASSTQQTQVSESSKPTPTVKKFKILYSDEALSALYELRVNPNESKKFLCALGLKNLSQSEISSIQIDVKGTLNVKIFGGSPSKVESDLSPDQTNSHNILFEIQNIEQPQKLNGTLSYTIDSNSEDKEFQLVVPSSTFILPIKLQVEDFFTILKSGSFSLAGADVKLEKDFQSFIVNLAVLLRVELISMDDKGAALYGKSIQGHHVALYVKVPPSGVSNVHLDIKSTSATLAGSLASEVISSFR